MLIEQLWGLEALDECECAVAVQRLGRGADGESLVNAEAAGIDVDARERGRCGLRS